MRTALSSERWHAQSSHPSQAIDEKPPCLFRHEFEVGAGDRVRRNAIGLTWPCRQRASAFFEGDRG